MTLRQRFSHPQSERDKLPGRNRVLSFKQWCELNGFSTATGRRLLAAGKCKFMRLSERRIGIGEDDNADFQAACRGGE